MPTATVIGALLGFVVENRANSYRKHPSGLGSYLLKMGIGAVVANSIVELHNKANFRKPECPTKEERETMPTATVIGALLGFVVESRANSYRKYPSGLGRYVLVMGMGAVVANAIVELDNAMRTVPSGGRRSHRGSFETRNCTSNE